MNEDYRISGRTAARFRTLLIIATCAALMWFSVAFTRSMTLGRISPESAAYWTISSSETRAEAASRLLNSGNSRDNARDLALSSLNRDPANATAARTLGLIATAEGRSASAERWMRYAERLSRRDLTTQGWMIDQAAGHNDIAGALIHYDRAMRTSISARSQWLGTLVLAADDPAIVRPLTKLLSKRPPWQADFFHYYLERSSSPAALSMIATTLSASRADDRPALSQAITRLVDQGRPDYAVGLFRQTSGFMHVPKSLIDGDFEGQGLLPPFGWTFASDAGLMAAVDLVEGGSVLTLIAKEGKQGEVARQLIMLAPGQYQLSFKSSATGTQLDRPEILLNCAGPVATNLLRIRVASGDNSIQNSKFSIERNCPAQWFAIVAYAAVDDTGDNGWIDDIQISASH